MMRQGPEFEAERKAVATQALDLAREYLWDKKLIRALGRFAEGLQSVAEHVQVAEVVDGRMVEFEGYEATDIIPLVFARTDEEITHTMHDHTPSQRRRYNGLAGALGLIEPRVGRDGTAKVGNDLTYALSTDQFALTPGAFFVADDPYYADFVFSNRAGIIVSIDGSLEDQALGIIHEIAHVQDALRRPLRKKKIEDVLLETEFYAYMIDNTTTVAITGNPAPGPIHRVENLRRRYNGSRQGENAFRASEAAKRALVRHGLGSVFEV